MKKVTLTIVMIVILSLSAFPALAQGDDDIDRPEGWDDYSHGNETEPDYGVVFPEAAVNTITITLSAENWQAMQADMTEIYGEFGSSPQMGGFNGQMPEGVDPGQMPQGGFNSQMPEGVDPGQMPQMPQGDMMMGGILGTDTNPIWVTADIEFNGETWTNVGMRFKGNSSLMSTWGSGNYKLPFKLDFDKFEDDYPQIDNQRFYGFEQVSFSSNWSDDSLLRERITADIFREAGVPASRTSFYAVYVDYGEGPVYFGLYTAVEVVDDTVIETQFDDDNGNVYKPEGTGATFAEGSFDEDSFEKETNEDEADYSDVLALFDALHSETRTTDPEAWRSQLESVFDVDSYLRWLAVNTIVQNWDTYGQMAHNYYLYNDEGVLTWIPWDNNMAMMEGMGGGFMRPRDGENAPANENMPMGGQGFPGGGEVSLDLDSVNSSWPLIRYLMDDPVYHDIYVTYVGDTINSAFAPETLTARMQELHDLIAPYVAQETEGYTNLSSPEAFDTALTDLITHVNERYTTAQEYIASQQQ